MTPSCIGSPPSEGNGGGGITDCGPDGGCEECDVCHYLNFLEWVGCVGKPDGSTVQRNAAIEAYLLRTYPETFGRAS